MYIGVLIGNNNEYCVWLDWGWMGDNYWEYHSTNQENLEIHVKTKIKLIKSNWF